MKLLVACVFAMAVIVSIVHCQEETNTEDRVDDKPVTDEPPKRRGGCPGFRGFFNGDRNGGGNGGFRFRRPPQNFGQDGEAQFNPNGFNGRRNWFQGRGRGGPNFGGAGPNSDIPDRGDVEFV